MKTLDQNVAEINCWMDGAEAKLDKMEKQGCKEQVIKVWRKLHTVCLYFMFYISLYFVWCTHVVI